MEAKRVSIFRRQDATENANNPRKRKVEVIASWIFLMLSNAARPINMKPKKKTSQEDFLGIVICAPVSVSKMAIQH